MSQIGTRKTESDLELSLFLLTRAAADWDAVLAVKCVEFSVLFLKAAWRQRAFDQVREIPLVHSSRRLALAAVRVCLRRISSL
jgi:hypothetical protein